MFLLFVIVCYQSVMIIQERERERERERKRSVVLGYNNKNKKNPIIIQKRIKKINY